MDEDYIKLGKISKIINEQMDELLTWHSPNRLKAIKSIITSGFNINYQLPSNSSVCKSKPEYTGYTALHFAVESRIETIILLLLSHAADVTRKNHDGSTPIRLAFEMDMKVDSLLSAHLQSGNISNPSCPHGISHFHIACSTTSSENTLNFFLNNGASVNDRVKMDSPKFSGYTPLHFAAEYSQLETARLLLQSGADGNQVNGYGMTPLQLLIYINMKIKDKLTLDSLMDRFKVNIETLKTNELLIDLLLNKKDVSYCNPIDDIGLTHLHIACAKQVCGIPDGKFLDPDVDINVPVKLNSPIWPGYTPLHFAAHFNFETVILLLQNGANLTAKDAKGVTPFDLCLGRYDPMDVRRILRVQANDCESIIHCLRLLDNFIQNIYKSSTIVPFDSTLCPGYTLLHLAVAMLKNCNYLKVGQIYNKFNNYLIMQDARGETPLHLAFRLKKKKVVLVLMKAHKMISANPINKQCLSHFHIACAVNAIQTVKMFLREGVDSNIAVHSNFEWYYRQNRCYLRRIKSGSTPLLVALAVGATDTIKELIKSGSNLMADDHGLATFLHINNKLLYFYSTYSAEKSKVKDLIRATNFSNIQLDDCNIPTLTRNILLHFAIMFDFVETVGHLIEDGADVKLKNAEGLNSLHVALLSGQKSQENTEIIKRLLEEFSSKESFLDDYGLTRAHVYCAIIDVDMVTRLGNEKDLNSQINFNSPIWPGDSPMHVLMRRRNFFSHIKDVSKYDVNFTHKNSENSTPLIFMYDNCPNLMYNNFGYTDTFFFISQFIDALKLIENREFFEMNSFNNEQMSHFHLCCASLNTEMVAQCLKYSEVDINAPKDYFAGIHAGYTPLHFAIEYNSEDVVELLIKHGADVCVENWEGLTPLYFAANKKPHLIDVILRYTHLDLNVYSIFGETVLSYSFSSELLAEETLQALLKCNASTDLRTLISPRRNYYYNMITHLVWCISNKTFIMFTKNVNLALMDNKDCSIIYYIRSDYDVTFMDSRLRNCYISNMEVLLSDYGFELDHKNYKGRTALHKAVRSNDYTWVSALLFLGADINIKDDYGKTPCSYKISKNPLTSPSESYLAEHILKLLATGLHVDELNKQFLNCKKHLKQYSNSSVQRELEESKNYEIDKSFSMRDFLKERTIVDYPRMALSRRQDIEKIIFDVDNLAEKFPQLHTLIKRQYRKGLLRRRMMEPATFSIRSLIGFELPGLCIEAIFKYLHNSDLMNLIRAVYKKLKYTAKK